MKTEYKVNVDDINYGGHMGNDRALTVFHQARIDFLEQFGYSELNIGEGIGIILAEANVKYKKEVFLNDVLDVEVELTEVKGLKWTLSYKATRRSDNAEVFNGSTIMLSFDYSARKICRIPSGFLEKIGK
ncbi:MAG: thioesterase family protein [Bacteroidota bacterium]